MPLREVRFRLLQELILALKVYKCFNDSAENLKIHVRPVGICVDLYGCIFKIWHMELYYYIYYSIILAIVL